MENEIKLASGAMVALGVATAALVVMPYLQVRDVPPGETVGYGATRTLKRPSRIAVLAVGYADGVFRALWVDNRTGIHQVWTAPITTMTVVTPMVRPPCTWFS